MVTAYGGADWKWASSAQFGLGKGVTMSTITPAAPVTSPARRELIRAWVSLGLMVPGAVGLMAFAEWAQVPDAPVLASVMTVVMLALVAAFVAGAVWFGVQAFRLGRRLGLVPAILAGLPVAFELLLVVADLLNGDKPLGG
jgi:fatty acid desaturase